MSASGSVNNALARRLIWWLVVLHLGASQAAEIPLIMPGSVWKYRDTGANLGTSWRNLNHNDNSWPSGAAQLGYGDGDEITTTGFGPDPDVRFVTTYFRHAFNVTNAARATNLTLQLLCDDGAVVYLNGTELMRQNMPAGTINFQTLASDNVGSPDENLFFPTNRFTTLLRNGVNVLAVEVHQSSTASGDLGFDLGLTYTGPDPPNLRPQITLRAPTNNVVYVAPAAVELEVSAFDPDGEVVSVEFWADDALLAVINESPYRWTWNVFDPGQYALVAVATDNRGSNSFSAEVHLAVYGSDPFPLVRPGSVWKYLDTGPAAPANWRSATFNDNSWRVGRAKLGYGDDEERTVVRYGTNENEKFITTYFRRAFYVVDPSPFQLLTFRLVRDDGGVVFLNGAEIFRSNMPEGAITSSTLAETTADGESELIFHPFSVPADGLVAGINVIAVEIHQRSRTSADLGFDLELTAFADPSPGAVTRGPYLQSATTHSVLVRWRSETPYAGRVLFGTNSNQLNSLADERGSAQEHIVAVEGLAPDTKYFYALGSAHSATGGGQSNLFFCTLPEPGSVRPVRVWVLGDSGTASVDARNVRDAYLNFAGRDSLDVWLMLGDNAYNTGTDLDYQAAVFNMYSMILRQTVLWPTIGNHDSAFSETATEFPYLDIFSLPIAGEAGGVASGTEKYYSFDYANIHFICLDSMTSPRETDGTMFTWLQNDLAATLQDWIIAFWHHPPYTKGSHDSDVEGSLIEMRARALPILEAGGVDLVLCGHSHAYERSFFLDGHYGHSSTLTSQMVLNPGDGRVDGDGAYFKGGSQPSRGAVYVVAGSSGQVSGGLLNHPAMFISRNDLGSLILDIDGPRLEARFLRETGAIDDAFTIRKPEPGTIPFLSIQMNQSGPKLTWPTMRGNRYRVQLATTLDPLAWIDLSEILRAEESSLSYVDASPRDGTRFYRIVLLP